MKTYVILPTRYMLLNQHINVTCHELAYLVLFTRSLDTIGHINLVNLQNRELHFSYAYVCVIFSLVYVLYLFLAPSLSLRSR